MKYLKKTFSLIELLIVVSIILILISLLSPSLNKMLRSAHETVCANGIRDLLITTHAFADDSNGKFMDLGNRPLYWTSAYWRKKLTTEYNLNRDHFYSPSNEKWNTDSFYYYNKGKDMVMARFYFGSSSVQGGLHNAISSKDRGTPTFASKNYEEPKQKVLWTDLNRKWNGYFLNPEDINRKQGANHLYAPDVTWPSLSHNGLIDGSIETPDQFEIKYRLRFRNADYHW